MSIFQDQQPYSYSTPQQTPYQQQLQRMTIQQLQGLQGQYNNAQQDPNFAIGDPHSRMLKENELVDDIYNRLGGAAMGGTGKSMASKAIVDYRLGLIDKQQQALQNLRQAMGQLYVGAQGQGQHITDVQGRYNPMTQMAMMGGASAFGNTMGRANIGGGSSPFWNWASGLWGGNGGSNGGNFTWGGGSPDYGSYFNVGPETWTG